MSELDAMKTLIRRAIKFSDWAAGEGLCPAGCDDTDQEERSPEEFFFAYSTATGDEDWNGLSDRVFARIAGLEAENDRLRKALESVSLIAGNLPDDLLCRATGANDARYRGGLICSARDIARSALEASHAA
jgi:hypothetical protein